MSTAPLLVRREGTPRQDRVKAYEADQRLCNGPIVERSCNDIICILLFIIFWGAHIFITYLSSTTGNPELLLHGLDSGGNLCGYTPGFEDYPMIYFAYPFPSSTGELKTTLSRTVCVRSCPNYSIGDTPPALECHPNKLYSTCETTQNVLKQNLIQIYPARNVLNLLCLPFDSGLEQTVQNVIGITRFGEGLKNIKLASSVIWIVLLATFFIAFLYMFLIKSCAKALVWLIILLYLGALAFAGYYCYTAANNFDSNLELTAEERLSKKKSFFIGAFLAWGLELISISLLLCLLDKIRILIEILENAADYITEESLVLVMPPVFFLFVLAYTVLWLWGLTCLWTMGGRDGQDLLPFEGWNWDPSTKYLFYFHLFAGIWNFYFLSCWLQFIISASVVQWYFSRLQQERKPGSSVYKAMSQSIKQIGTIIYGALVIAIVRIVRIIFGYIYYELRREGLTRNAIVDFFAKCCTLCLDCFERFIRIVNNHAFIEAALTGKGFCEATNDGFSLLMCNAVTFGLAAGLGSAFVLIGKLFLIAFGCTAGLFMMTRVSGYTSVVPDPLYPTILLGILAFVLGEVFMEVWGKGVDGLVHCYLVDIECHRLQGQPPKYCPERL